MHFNITNKFYIKSRIMFSIKVLSILLFITTTLIITISQETKASGVFELELIQLEQLDLKPTINFNKKNNSTNNYNELQHQQVPQHEDFTSLIRIFVCLKEAFTSQLDGPCTFGNASLTLNRDSINLKSDHNMNLTKQQGSQLTNLVRILFTFRWTKSFTIILTAEQLQTDSLNHQTTTQTQLRQWSASIPQVLGSKEDNNGSNSFVVDSSVVANKKFLKEPANEPPQNLSTMSNSSGVQIFIDRHVLTENEVLPNLEQNSNKPWANRYSRSLKSSLEYKFRVYCSLNYYGDGCTTFCRARDDQFGHYNCSLTGQKVCLDGWEGSDCDKAKCRSGCNQLHGYCDKPNTCECRPGWTGPRCDECLTYPGCQNGYCLTSWQCICQQNWGGVLCDQDLNYCGSHDPCKNNGTCQNISAGKYKCHCPTGFTGVDCGLNLSLLPGAETLQRISLGCALNPCLNGGTCLEFNGISDKSRTQTKVSTNFSSDPILYEPESLNEEYIASESEKIDNRYYRCQCAPGWVGDYCQWSDSNIITNLELNHLASTTMGTYIDTTNVASDNQETLDSNTVLNNNQTIESTIENKYIPYVESNHVSITPQHVEMRHLISWVVIATIIGVFLACLSIVWCCLLAIERNKFSFIQMNIIRNADCGSQQHDAFSSRLRRMQEKIRDSFRRSSSSRIKPETKLSIENVLKPPPSYEESSNYCLDKIQLESSNISNDTKLSDKNISKSTKENLVIQEDIEQNFAQPQMISVDAISTNNRTTNIIENTNIMNCPRHGHLYRQKQLEKNYHYLNHGHQIWTGHESTYITIEGRNPKRHTYQETNHNH